jgi:hypothetical protein
VLQGLSLQSFDNDVGTMITQEQQQQQQSQQQQQQQQHNWLQRQAARHLPGLDCVVLSDTAARSLPRSGETLQQKKRASAIQPAAAAAAAAGPGRAGGMRAGGSSSSQAKLDMFFLSSTQQQQQQNLSSRGSHLWPGGGSGSSSQATAAKAVRQAGGSTPLSPLPLIRIAHGTSSSNKNKCSDVLDSSRPPRAAAAAAAANFCPPLTKMKGPKQEPRLPASAAAALRGAGCLQQQQQQPAVVPPWSAPLTEAERALDLFDLVNMKVFGHSGFRPGQKAVVQQARAGRDLFVLMPTGGGKSLCYQVMTLTCHCKTYCMQYGSTVNHCSSLFKYGEKCTACRWQQPALMQLSDIFVVS